MVAIALNENRVIDQRVVGDERTPVIAIDDAISSIEPLRSMACDDGNFVQDRRVAYPGVRSSLPATYIDVVTAELIPARPIGPRLGSLKDAVAPPPDAFFEPLDDDEVRLWESG